MQIVKTRMVRVENGVELTATYDNGIVETREFKSPLACLTYVESVNQAHKDVLEIIQKYDAIKAAHYGN